MSFERFDFWHRVIGSILFVLAVLTLLIIIGIKARGAEFTVVANHGPAGPYCAFPGACRMADGRIICVYYNGTGHVTTTNQRECGGAIAYTLSEDDGQTWSEPSLLLDTDLDDRDPSISLLTDGRLMLTYFRLYTFPPPLRGDGVYIANVIQGPTLAATGESVGLVTEIPKKLQHDAGCSSPIRDFGNGLLMLGSYHLDQPYVLRSPDNGKVWQVFDIPNAGKHLDAETDVIELRELGDGGALPKPYERDDTANADECPTNGLPRTGSPNSRLFYAILRGSKCNGHYSTSIDGKNWTVAKDIGFVLHCPELHRVQLAQQTLAGEGASIVDNKPDAVGASVLQQGITRRNVGVVPTAILLAHRVPATAMHYSLDECKTWVGPIQVDSCGGAYPCFVTCKDGSVLIVYYTEGTNSHIRCRRFTITKEGILWEKPKH